MNRPRKLRRPRWQALSTATALLAGLHSIPARAAPGTASERAAAEARYEKTDSDLTISTAAMGGGAGMLLLAGIVFHVSASRKADQCSTGLDTSRRLDVAGIRACQQATSREWAGNVSFLGAGLAGVGAIITGALLAKHRRKGPQRVTLTGDGVLVRF